jgi:hypothetical protein
LRYEKQDVISDEEDATSGYTTMDFTARVRVAVLEDRFPISVTLNGGNLTDSKARNHVAFNNDEVRLPGRGIRAAIHGRF